MHILFGGTFDPVHDGHLAMIDGLINAFPDALVHVIPNRHPPHRMTEASSEHRLAMLEAVLGKYSKVILDQVELDLQGPSYSVKTLEFFRSIHGENEPLVLGLGADAAEGFGEWHQPQQVLELAHVCVLDRAGQTAQLPNVMGALIETGDLGMLAQFPSGYLVRLKTPIFSVSSTEVRKRIREGNPELLVPEKIKHYISKHSLYRTH